MSSHDERTHGPATNQIIAVATGLEAKTETIVELAEQFHQEQDLLGMTACTMALAKVITLAAGFPENIEEEGGNVHFSLRRKRVIADTKARFQALYQRAHQLTYDSRGQPVPKLTSKQINAVQTAATTIEALSDAQAVAALAVLTADTDMPPDLRWGAYGIAQGITDRKAPLPDHHAIASHEDWATAANTMDRVSNAVKIFQATTENRENTLKQAGKQICREHGIDEPSDQTLSRPGLIRNLSFTKDPDKRYQFGIDAADDDHEDFVDTVMFNYRGLTYTKTISEPFPTGFPAPTAMEIAAQYLSRCHQPDRTPRGADWETHRQTGLDALRLAQLQLHCLHPDDAADFIRNISRILPEREELVRQIMRVATGREESVENALLHGKLKTAPPINDTGAKSIIKEARHAGLGQTGLWELAKLLSVDPGQYGIRRPTLSENEMDQVALAAEKAGIPEHIIIMIAEETSSRT